MLKSTETKLTRTKTPATKDSCFGPVRPHPVCFVIQYGSNFLLCGSNRAV